MCPSARFSVPPIRILCAWAVVLGGFAGCYHPSLREGAPCASSDQCPEPQRCVLGSCSLGEAPPIDAWASAPPDAMADASPPPVDAMLLPCSTAGLTCNGAVTMFTCGGNCWVRCSASVARETASAACAGWTGALGEIDNADEQTCVASHLGGLTWIGLIQSTDVANTPSTGWTWNGTANPVTYTLWAGGQPDDATSSTNGLETGKEQCALLRIDGTWADDPCTNPRNFFCERPQPAS